MILGAKTELSRVETVLGAVDSRPLARMIVADILAENLNDTLEQPIKLEGSNRLYVPGEIDTQYLYFSLPRLNSRDKAPMLNVLATCLVNNEKTNLYPSQDLEIDFSHQSESLFIYRVKLDWIGLGIKRQDNSDSSDNLQLIIQSPDIGMAQNFRLRERLITESAKGKLRTTFGEFSYEKEIEALVNDSLDLMYLLLEASKTDQFSMYLPIYLSERDLSVKQICEILSRNKVRINEINHRFIEAGNYEQVKIGIITEITDTLELVNTTLDTK